MDRTEGLWPVRVGLFPDESFVSWFTRVAWAHGLSTAELYRTAIPGERLGGKDLDRHLGQDLAANLERHTGVSAPQIRQAGFQRWCGTVYPVDDGAASIPWLPVAGRVYHRSAFGQQICPACLRDDEEPYLRADWRLSFVTCCPRHARLLLDRCLSCGNVIRTDAQPKDGPFPSHCPVCGSRYSTAALPRHSRPGRAAQEHLLAVAGGEWPLLGEYGHIHPVLYFRLIWRLFRLVATGRHARALRRALTTDKEFQTAGALPQIKEVERLNPRARHELIVLALRLTDDWPKRFIAACEYTGLHQWLLLKDKASVPFAYSEAVARHLSRSHHKTDPSEISWATQTLRDRNLEPTYTAVRKLVGVKFQGKRLISELAGAKVPLRTNRYWKLDGVSPTTRQAVRKAAHRSGENVGAWVDQALQRALSEKH